MKQRERILELVKQGIISTEEALVLLENAAKKEGKEAIKKENAHTHVEEPQPTPPKTPEDSSFEDSTEDPAFSQSDEDGQDENFSNEEQKDREQLEKILESLANEASSYSVKLDEKNLEIAMIKSKLRLVQEKLMVLETKEDLEGLNPEKLP